MVGPWLIYDHYLIVKELSPNFHPANDKILNVVVWVHIYRFPIKNYNAKALKFIENCVGKIVKVDKNTLMHDLESMLDFVWR